MKIPFKAVAVDMDGTFLNDNKEYDHQLFKEILAKLKVNDIEFIVASGNQYFKTVKDFGELADQINFVSENGSFLVSDNKVLGKDAPKREILIALINFLQEEYPQYTFIVSGEKSAYVSNKYDRSFLDTIPGPHIYYPHLIELDNLNDIPKDDVLLKIALNADDETSSMIINRFNAKYGKYMYPTSSGVFATDLMGMGVSKASGLKKMLKKLNISPKELIAFGDGGNDVTMLQLAGISYAMENASTKLKKIADYIAPNNNNQGVLKVLNQYLE